MKFPVDDWQFWMATLIVFVAMVAVARPIARILFGKRFAKPKKKVFKLHK